MRTAPIGLIPSFDAATSFRLGVEAAALTHGHPSGFLSAGMVSALVQLLIDDTPLESAIDHCRRLLLTYPNHQETLDCLNAAVNLAANQSLPHPLAVHKLGGGWVGEEALAIALYSVLAARSYAECLSIAANHSGDSDSTASIAGQLWGAALGLEGIPHDWVMKLDVLLPLLRLARSLLPIKE